MVALADRGPHFHGESLVESCERTVRSGGGLVKYAGMVSARRRVAARHCSYAKRTPQVSGQAQDSTRGGAWDRVLYRMIENLACLWQINTIVFYDLTFG